MDVAHIPLSLRHQPSVGYFSYFSNAHSISQATAGEYAPQLDKTSIREGKNIDMVKEISWLTQREIDLDNSIDTDTESRILVELHDRGVLIESRVNVSSCYYGNPRCGKTEYQAIDDNSMKFVANKHRLDIDGLCGLCENKLETHEENVLLLKVPNNRDGSVSIRTPYLKNNFNACP